MTTDVPGSASANLSYSLIVANVRKTAEIHPVTKASFVGADIDDVMIVNLIVQFQ